MDMPTRYGKILNYILQKQQQKSYPDVDLSKQKICEAKSHQKMFC